ncbi:hypothetical protein [Microbulbifer sp. DLAB2-AA]|uniref:hypothetical protein n=1 Tax=Microbulbifer sp. DLAB2-AA TaxID=3243394 RepID=UPI00403A4DBA
MSLEHPGPGFNGTLGRVGQKANLLDLEMFVRGYESCLLDAYGEKRAEDEWLDFIEYLRHEGLFPTEGWAAKISQQNQYSEDCFEYFRELLHKYLVLRMPDWFIEFNCSAQPSPWHNVNGPRSQDIRLKKHIVAVNKA